MPTLLLCLSLLPLIIWSYLLVFRGGFWRGRERLDGTPVERPAWPDVVAIVPARNEAEVVGQALSSLLCQDYPGRLHVILVDDHSEDGTSEVAAMAAEATGREDRVLLRRSDDLPPGWLGKPWALSEGLRFADKSAPEAPYIWLTDADIVHDPYNLRRLVAKAEAEDLDQVSQMVMLKVEGFWARLLIPAFVFFFQKLYPFAWINDHRHHTAGAAGGCVLLRRAALAAAGGFEVIRDALIDDCTLAGAIRQNGRLDQGRNRGRLWLGLTTAAESLRPYHQLADIWRMVARSAYTQLNHSPLLLAGTLVGLVASYLLAPTLAITLARQGLFGFALLNLLTWALMAAAFLPTLRLYRQPTILALLLPLAALLYAAMTFGSALAHWRGRGGTWKGRVAGRTALEQGGSAS